MDPTVAWETFWTLLKKNVRTGMNTEESAPPKGVPNGTVQTGKV